VVCYGASLRGDSLRGDSLSLVELKATTQYSVSIWLDLPDNSEREVAVNNYMTVRMLKQRIEKDFVNIPVENQKLTFGGQVLEDRKILVEYYDLFDGDRITVSAK